MPDDLSEDRQRVSLEDNIVDSEALTVPGEAGRFAKGIKRMAAGLLISGGAAGGLSFAEQKRLENISASHTIIGSGSAVPPENARERYGATTHILPKELVGFLQLHKDLLSDKAAFVKAWRKKTGDTLRFVVKTRIRENSSWASERDFKYASIDLGHVDDTAFYTTIKAFADTMPHMDKNLKTVMHANNRIAYEFMPYAEIRDRTNPDNGKFNPSRDAGRSL